MLFTLMTDRLQPLTADANACGRCLQAYNILRHSAGLLLSLLHLMAGAPVTDLAADPSKALLKLQVRSLQRPMNLAASQSWTGCQRVTGTCCIEPAVACRAILSLCPFDVLTKPGI